MTNLNALRNEYRDLTGQEADGRWGEPKLNKELTVQRAKAAERQAAFDAAEAKRQAAKEEREARAAARGSWEQFCDRAYTKDSGLSEEEMRLAYVARRMKNQLQSAEGVLADFAEKLAEDPSYALSWGMRSFEAAAERYVSLLVKSYVVSGATYDDLKSMATKEALRGARFPERSTSVTSNLMAQCTTAAWAALVELMSDA